ncbi:hypothetical protein MCOL2_15907 [Listeria fleischmannii FSL S10-1203]|uniref:Uncharacterized protein n=1 Tax=Listeria fleischmannii FSL S10-1203 TaxID=1265822 RepID=W7DN49_9LIST|nr:hypothetical protein MCOL2_15907 [Listeria fleischmannii FSL S10-1203]
MFRQNELIQLSDLLSITAKEDFEIIKAEELLEACTKNEELKFTLLHYTESLNAEVRHFYFLKICGIFLGKMLEQLL